MDVRACEKCKKLNTETPLFFVLVLRQPKSRQEFAAPDDPLIGVRWMVSSASVPRYADVAGPPNQERELCFACGSSEVTRILDELKPTEVNP